jgi:hypothetical protein
MAIYQYFALVAFTRLIAQDEFADDCRRLDMFDAVGAKGGELSKEQEPWNTSTTILEYPYNKNGRE